MLLDFALPEHERKLIPEGRVSGPMPWVIAIMMFLTLLAAAAGLLLVDAARQGGDDLSSRVTVRILEPDPTARTAQRAAIAKSLRDLLAPWLGDDIEGADIAIPALVDVNFSSAPDAAKLSALKRQLAPLSPNIQLDSQWTWMAPYFSLMRGLLILAGGILLLLLLATSAVVVLAVRSALNTHEETLGIMHMMGGTDLQAARLFQRRAALDALLGGVIGFVAAAATFWFLAGRFAAVDPGLLGGATLPWYGWIVLALIPLAVTGLAMLMARLTVLNALKKML
jgi:cell division transport system permease protein